MKPRSEADRKIEQILDSLDGIGKAEPRPYFFTRVMARLEREQKTVWERAGAFISRPAVVVGSLVLVLVLNVFVLFRQDDQLSGANGTAVNLSGQLVTDNEYIIASSSSFDYENFDPQ